MAMRTNNANKAGCSTITWKIENISLLLSASDDTGVSTPVFKTETSHGSKWWYVSFFTEYTAEKFHIMVNSYQESPKLHKCELSFLSAENEIVLESKPTCRGHAYTTRDKKLLYNIDSVLRNDTLTIRCKLWNQFQKPEDRIYHTVLHKDSLFLDIEQGELFKRTFFKKDSLSLSVSIQSLSLVKLNYLLIVVVPLPVKDSHPSDLYCTLSIRNVQGHVIAKKPWLYIRSEMHVKLSEPNVKNVEFQLEYFVAVHLNSPAQISEASSLHPSKSVPGATGELSDDLHFMSLEESLSNSTTQTTDLSVHRRILAAKSPAFSAMFEKQELNTRELQGVPGMDSEDTDTLDRMLGFLYGGSIEGLQWEEVSRLYSAADKYDVLPLKQKCADILKTSMTADNACDALVLADKVQDEHLMKCFVDFLMDHLEVISSVKWRDLEDENPRLISKVTREILLKKGKQNRTKKRKGKKNK